MEKDKDKEIVELPINEYHEQLNKRDKYHGYNKRCLMCGRFVPKKDWSFISSPICNNHFDVIE